MVGAVVGKQELAQQFAAFSLLLEGVLAAVVDRARDVCGREAAIDRPLLGKGSECLSERSAFLVVAFTSMCTHITFTKGKGVF